MLMLIGSDELLLSSQSVLSGRWCWLSFTFFSSTVVVVWFLLCRIVSVCVGMLAEEHRVGVCKNSR